eukprot:CAMPEP_0197022610 /NCGR_PEP_ID=MMETSP1384-20130603/3439_1 /TAXON_ID=29189 /ORGANISM="Ammonia sp." /LENGTH=203 /DNA_ID=CAMNT_0042450679 /DNA_START=95 /DNA_END=706 /DNA_ORIENTATION=+
MADDEKKQDAAAAAKVEHDYETVDDKQLIELMKAKASEVLIVDVRDPDEEEGDYQGGHVKGSINVPSFDVVDKLPELITANNVKEKKTVVFLCMAGKGNSPQSYRSYNKARSLLTKGDAKKDDSKDDEFTKIVHSIKLDANSLELLKQQKVYVLKGGFHTFLNYHKDDKDLVEGFDEKMWDLTQLQGDDDEGLALYHKNYDEQ